MQVKLDYGRTGLTVTVPDHNLEGVLTLQEAKAHYWPERGVRDAARQPIGCPPLPGLARGKKSACIVISDITRPVPNRAILPQLLGVLDVSGVPREATTILVATGTHRPCTEAELREMVGEEILRDYHVVNHDARDPDTHRYLGDTPKGVPMWVDTRFLDAELKISVALIEPHFMAGFSGGRKNICPGICAMETVKVWHGPRFIGHELSDSGSVDGNPVHEDALYVALKAGLDFICDVTMDENRKVTGIFAGDPEKAWLRGVQAAREAATAEVSQPVDIVVTTTAGYPLDLTFYQVAKGMVGALPILKENGTIVIASRCEEGVGGKEFTDTLLRIDDLDAFVEETRQPGFFIPDQWEIHELAKARARAEVLMYTEGIPAETLEQCFVKPVPSVEEGIRQALDKHGPLARIAVIPKGPYVLPRVAGQQ
ncbi:MAG: nickel-dependent lactate racemase [Armatimonadota bacterium]